MIDPGFTNISIARIVDHRLPKIKAIYLLA
jgi:hypothetical protein